LEAQRLLARNNKLTHFAGIIEGRPTTPADMMVFGLTYEDMRQIPPKQNPIVWLIWHNARSEDAINLQAFGKAQVLDEEGWMERMRCDRRDIGTGMTAEEVSEFARTVDVQAVLDYYTAVGQRTRDHLRTLSDEDLMAVPDDHRERALHGGLVVGEGKWVTEANTSQGRPVYGYLLFNAAGHNFMHLGECGAVRGQLGKPFDPRSLITATTAS
jgi:hypothetical protein